MRAAYPPLRQLFSFLSKERVGVILHLTTFTNNVKYLPITLFDMEIVARDYHPNGSAQPFVAAIVDDPLDGDTKLVIMFGDTDFLAVLSLDSLQRDEDISNKGNGYHGDKYEKLRNDLWEDLY